MKIHQAGFRNVVGLMGCSLSEHQVRLISARFRQAVLFLDGDNAGREATDEIGLRLMRLMFLKVVDTPHGKQPDQLSEMELQGLLKLRLLE